MAMAPSGNVFCDPDKPGVRLNPENMRAKDARGVTRFNSPDGGPASPAPAREPRNDYGMTETEEDGGATPSAAAQAQANVGETISSIRSLKSQARQGNRAAQSMIQTLAATERALPGGGRSTVLRELQSAGV